MALKYVAVQSGGYDVTDPVSVRAATRPSTWPQIPLSSEILDDRVYLLFDATGAYCLPQFNLNFTGDVVCKMHLYKDTTLFRTDTVSLTSNTYNTTQYAASSDYNYVLVEISGGEITTLTIASESNLKYDGIGGQSYTPTQLLEISGKLDSLTSCDISKSNKLKYFGVKKSNGTYTCSLVGLYSLIAVLEYKTSSPRFQNCSSLASIPQLDTSGITNMSNMFDSCYALTYIPQLNTSSVTNMSSMFRNCYSLTSIPQLNTSNVANMSNMFYDCRLLTSIPQLNTSSITNMTNMFYDCNSLVKINGTSITKTTTFSQSFWVSHDELVEIIGNLPDLTGLTAQTLTLGSTLRNKLSADEIAVATNKNWTVA